MAQSPGQDGDPAGRAVLDGDRVAVLAERVGGPQPFGVVGAEGGQQVGEAVAEQTVAGRPRVGRLRHAGVRRRCGEGCRGRAPVAAEARDEVPCLLQAPAVLRGVPHEPADERGEAADERVVAGQQGDESGQAVLVGTGVGDGPVGGEQRVGAAQRVQDRRAQGVQVDARRERGGHLVGGAQFGCGVAGGGAEHPAFTGRCGHLQVDEEQAPVGGDHDVVGVEVVQGDAEPVRGGDQLGQLPDEGVGGARVGAGGALGGEALRDGAAQGGTGYGLGGEEDAALLLEHLDGLRDAVAGGRGETPEEGRLAAQQVADVEPFESGADVRAGLLDDDLGAGAGVLGAEDAALVGVLDGAPDDVSVGEEDGSGGGRAAGRGGRAVREGVAGPGGRTEPGVALVLDGAALRVGEPGRETAVGGQLSYAREHAVPVGDLAVGAVAAVGEDGRTGQARGGPVQLLGEQPEPVVVGRVDGEELAAPAAGGAPGDQRGDPRGAAGELEGRAVGDEHLGGAGQDQRGGQRGGGDVQFPALCPADGSGGHDVAPERAGFDGPADGAGAGHGGAHQVGQEREVGGVLGAGPAGAGAGRERGGGRHGPAPPYCCGRT